MCIRDSRKITLRLPKGTNVTRLAPNIDYGSGTGTAVADEFTSGRSHDFTNPVQYVLTAPDGVTKITYTAVSYTHLAGLEQVIEYIENLRFTDADIEYLRGRCV